MSIRLRSLVKTLSRRGRAVPILTEVALLTVVAEVGIRVVGIEKLSRTFGAPLDVGEPDVGTSRDWPGSGPGADRSPPEPLGADLRRVHSAIVTFQRRTPFETTCLRRALVAGFLLRRHRPRLRIGVARSGAHDGSIDAHAWLEFRDGDRSLTYGRGDSTPDAEGHREGGAFVPLTHPRHTSAPRAPGLPQ